MNSNECKMTFSAFVPDKSGKRIVRVQIERAGAKGTDRAEAILPGARIEKAVGFTDDETAQLVDYLKANEADILARAKEISNPMRWMS